jgi:restriction system protein
VSFIFNLIVAMMVVLVAYAAFEFWRYRRKMHSLRDLYADVFTSAEEMQRTMAMGLYARFRKQEEDETHSKLFLREDPLLFEDFVARVMKGYCGGNVSITQSSGDFGVDIEHMREDGLYLGQVKCYYYDLPYEPIALIHSQMVKQGAAGGFVVTTGSFTDNALDYWHELKAQGVNIDLIDGQTLVKYWAEAEGNKARVYESNLETL